MKKALILSLIFLISQFLWSPALAASGDLLGSASIELNPSFPKPNQSVRATVSTFATDINRANITWLVNGVVVSQGAGEKSISFETGNPGTTTTVAVRVSSQSSGTLTDSITITPAEVDLIWESDTYTPPFYKGKALHSSQSNVSIIAIPQIRVSGNKVPQNQLVYEWKINGEPRNDVSGIGRNAVQYQGPRILGRDIVEVVVSTQSGNIYASNSVSVNTVDPEIYFYKDDPLKGIDYARVLGGSLGLLSEEYTLRVEPYYVTKTDYDTDNLQFSWTLNGELISLESNPESLTIRHAGTEGVSTLRLEISNIVKSLQEAGRSINVYYGNTR